MQKTMAWAFEGRLHVIVHGPTNPTALEWERFLTETVARRSQGAQPSERGRAPFVVLVVSHGGVPDGGQRMQLAKTIERNAAPTVIMTNSGAMLNISRVLTFFNPRQKAVALGAHEAAFEFLALSADERAAAKRLRAKLEEELAIR
jgi:hypothetical protein